MARRKKKYKVSKAEKEILQLLENRGHTVVPQFIIPHIPYIYDFYFPKLNIILEYQGDYFHANPTKYASGSIINMLGMGKVFVDHIWNKDELKKRSAEQQGFIVCILWEADYKRFGWEAVERSLTC